MKQRFHAACAFTLFELLVVIAIIGVLAAVAVPRFADFRAAAYDSRSQQDLRNLAAAQELHRASAEAYATNPGELTGFVPSDGVEIVIEHADRTAFRARAEHEAGRRVYSWDSAARPPLTASQRPR